MEAPTRGVRPRALAAIALLATIALVAAGASPAEAVPIKRGHTKLILDQDTSSGLDALGIGILRLRQRRQSVAESSSRSLAAGSAVTRTRHGSTMTAGWRSSVTTRRSR